MSRAKWRAAQEPAGYRSAASADTTSISLCTMVSGNGLDGKIERMALRRSHYRAAPSVQVARARQLSQKKTGVRCITPNKQRQ
jgi:hypothetical protein